MIPRDTLRRWRENDLPVDVRTQWMRHVRAPDSVAFPRDIGMPHRRSVGDLGQMIDELHEVISHSSVYVQVYSDIQQLSQIWDTAYIDLDAEIPFDADDGTYDERREMWREQLRDAHWELQKYVWYLESEWDVTPRVYFSGSRGFSVYVDFPETEAPYGAVRSTMLHTLNESETDMSLVDTNVMEPNRISRPPYTLNWNHQKKRGLDPMLVLPIDPDWGWDTFWDEITDPSRFREIEIDPDPSFAAHISSVEQDQDFASEDIGEIPDPDPGESLEKIERILESGPQIRDGRHRILQFLLVPALIEAGWEDRAQIHETCQSWIEDTGRSYSEYRGYVDGAIDRTLEGPSGTDGPWRSWSFARFLREHPDLISQFTR